MTTEISEPETPEPDVDEKDPPSDDAIAHALPSRALYPVLKTESGERLHLRALLRIDPQALVFNFQIHPAWQATIGWQTARYEVRMGKASRDLDRMEAALYIEHRDRLAAEGKRAPGVELIKAYVTSDPRLVAAQDRVFKAQEELGAWKAANGALHARRECLINMGAELRIERKGSTPT